MGCFSAKPKKPANTDISTLDDDKQDNNKDLAQKAKDLA